MDYKEKIIALLNSQELSNEQKEKLELIFPELKESEDERIRNSLSAYFAKFKPNDMWDDDFSFGGIVAWLEKISEQKEVSKVKPKFRIGDVIEVKPMKCHGKILTDKPNKIVDITEKSYILDDGKAYSIELQDGWKLSEQNPAWSEEDEKMLEYAIDMIEWYSVIDKSKSRQVSDWLKSLRPQNGYDAHELLEEGGKE